MRIYLDMCCYNRPYDDQTQLKVYMEAQSKLHIQDSIRNGEFELIYSYTLDYELSRNPFDMRRESIKEFIQNNAKWYVGEEREEAIKPIADEIMTTGVKEKDAYHIASAVYAKCDYFITTDKRILNYNRADIKLVSPIEFVTETEKE